MIISKNKDDTNELISKQEHYRLREQTYGYQRKGFGGDVLETWDGHVHTSR